MANKKSSITKQLEDDAMPETDVSNDFINFFLDELKSMYWSEKHMGKSYTKLKKVATNNALKESFAAHIATTQIHSERLEQVFELLGASPRANKCEAMAGMSEEVNGILEETEKGSVIRDTALALVAQKLKLYKISTYSGIVQLARTMGNEDIISVLEDTLQEEETARELFTAFAESILNAAPEENSKRSRKKIKDEEGVAVYDSINLTNKTTKS